MLKLKLQYCGHLMWRADSLEKTLMLGKSEGRRRRGHRGWCGWMASLTWWTWIWVSSGRWWRTGKPDLLQSMRSQRVRQDWVTEQQRMDYFLCDSWSATTSWKINHYWEVTTSGHYDNCHSLKARILNLKSIYLQKLGFKDPLTSWNYISKHILHVPGEKVHRFLNILKGECDLTS